jgi:hypothetical protein
VWLFERASIGIAPRRVEPDRGRPDFSHGSFGAKGPGRYMSETHAPFWIYGSGRLELQFAPSPLARRVRVDGRTSTRLGERGWHLVTVDVPRLRQVPGEEHKVGLQLLRLGFS